MEDKKMNVNVGGGFTSLLTVAFIVLKLCGVINWAWVWVLSPIWISLGIVLAIVLIVLIIALIRNIFNKIFWW